MADPSIQKPPPVAIPAIARPNAYPISYRASTVSSLDSLRYHGATTRSTVFRLRTLLGSLAIVITVIMGISIIFVAHTYYQQWGGQGFLKARGILSMPDNTPSTLFLPLRKVQMAPEAHADASEALLMNLPWNTRSLGPGMNVPYYTCGDQQNSCEAYDQPNICCPVKFNCYKGSFTNSGIFCCNATRSEFDCEHAEEQAPKCMDGLVECSKATGGGCCPSAMECSPNGCIHVNPASTVSSANTSTSATASDTSSATPTSDAPSSATHNSVSVTGTPITVTNYITIAPKATVTLAKTGETVDAGSGAGKSLVTKMYLPYSFGCALLGVAFFMGMM